jgi:hypothetical protein
MLPPSLSHAFSMLVGCGAENKGKKGLMLICHAFRLIYGIVLELTYVGFWDWFMQDFWGFEIDICKIFGTGLCRFHWTI